MKGEFNTDVIKNWRDFFEQNMELPVLTRTSTISLKELEEFISEAKGKYGSGFNGIRIYFVRYDLKEGQNPPHILEAGKDKNDKRITQVSLAFVPINELKLDTLKGEDFVLPGTSNKVFAIRFCHPDDVNPSTGHCPPLGCEDI